ncbi:MAG: hypothetical protein U0T31_05000 [Chitinophagales bacterium]
MTGTVSYINMKNEVLTFRCEGIGSNKDDAIRDAQINGFKILFFRGVPGSTYSAPMISVNESNELEKNKTYFDELFNQKRYLSFVTSSIIASVYNTKEKKVSIEISINTRSLRQDLVSNKVLSDYGF